MIFHYFIFCISMIRIYDVDTGFTFSGWVKWRKFPLLPSFSPPLSIFHKNKYVYKFHFVDFVQLSYVSIHITHFNCVSPFRCSVYLPLHSSTVYSAPKTLYIYGLFLYYSLTRVSIWFLIPQTLTIYILHTLKSYILSILSDNHSISETGMILKICLRMRIIIMLNV